MSAKKCVRHSLLFLLIIFSLIPPLKTAFSQEFVVLRLIINEEDKGEFFLVLAPDNDVWIKREDLNKTGLKQGSGREILFNQERYISLKSIPGLEFQINEEEVSLRITAAPHLFREQDFDISYKRPYKVIFTEDNSAAFLNYALVYEDKAEETFFDVSGELGISVGDYLGMSTFSFEKTEDTENAVRLMTSLTVNDRKKLRTATFGDFSALSGVLGSGVVLGGINFSRNFSIDPYFLRYPSLNLGGTIETPSEVEVYLEGLPVRKKRLSPGEFLFSDVPATIGLGTARIVIKDAYGRERIISTPYYHTDRLLKKGFHEYSYSIGFVREDMGVKSFVYGNPAFLSFHNFGFSRELKAGYAAEVSGDLINIGPAASILISKAGVIDVSFALSRYRGEAGASGFLGYSFQSGDIGARISLRSDSEEYSNLTTSPSDDKARFQFNGAAGFGRRKTGFITASYSFSGMYAAARTSRAAISYNRAVTKSAALFIIASETKNTVTNDEIFLGLHIYLGRDTSAGLSYTGSEGSETEKISIRKSLPVGSGLGYRADVENFNGRNNIEGDLQYQNSYGTYELGFSNGMGDKGYRFSVSGGIGYIDKSVFFSRPITDSFAKVKVDGLEGVRVYYYGNEVGETNRSGEVIIPNIRSFYDNRIDIEYRDIPINYTISSLTRYISPPYRSGSMVKFDVSKIQGIAGAVYILEKGKEIPVEFAIVLVQIKEKTVEGPVGRDGEFYLENIPPGKHPAKVVYRGKECRFDIIIPDSKEMLIDLGKIVCEAGK